MAEGQGIESNREGDDHTSLGTTLGEKTARPQGQEPHAQTESTQETSETFADLPEDERETTEDGSGEENSDQVTALHGIADRRTHDINNQDLHLTHQW